MKTFSVLYIDDDKDEDLKITPLVRELSAQNKIKIKLEYPRKLEPFVDHLVEKHKKMDAVIIDLRLNENHKGKEDFATYPAQVLATAIRTYQNGENKRFEEFPIFLISSLEKKASYFDTDVQSHDLFDLFISKNDIPRIGSIYEDQIHAIISAYNDIKDARNVWELLDIDEKNYRSLSLSFDFDDKLASSTSQFLLNQVILRNGILINEEVLAARLGVDIDSSKDWEALKKELNKSLKYTGIYGNVWARWWANKLIDWWEDEISRDSSLINSDASQRVSLLKEKLKLKNLQEAKPIEPYMSTSFWTICKALNQPLDTYDGLLLNTGNENWQDKEYVSPTAVIEGDSKRNGYKLHPDEKERYKEIKIIYKKRKYGN